MHTLADVPPGGWCAARRAGRGRSPQPSDQPGRARCSRAQRRRRRPARHRLPEPAQLRAAPRERAAGTARAPPRVELGYPRCSVRARHPLPVRPGVAEFDNRAVCDRTDSSGVEVGDTRAVRRPAHLTRHLRQPSLAWPRLGHATVPPKRSTANAQPSLPKRNPRGRWWTQWLPRGDKLTATMELQRRPIAVK